MVKDNKVKEDVLNTSEETNFILNIKQTPEHILSWLTALEETEQIILSILYQEEKALAIQDIRSQLVDNSVDYYSKVVDKDNKVICSTLQHQKYVYPFDAFFRLNNTERKNIQGIKDLAPESFEENVSLPAFRKIKDRINNLVDLKVVFSRNPKNQKELSSYFLNPIIRIPLSEKYEKKLDKYKERVEKHKDRQLEFDKIVSGRYRQ